MASEDFADGLNHLLDTPDLAGALGSDSFKLFLDQIPIAVAVSELHPVERVVYANLEFERVSGQSNAVVLGGDWRGLPGVNADGLALGKAVTAAHDHLGFFSVPDHEAGLQIEAWSNIIQNEVGDAAFRLVALLALAGSDGAVLDKLAEQVREKDTQLLELQHRVKNNLQMITALIRIEARGLPDRSTGEGFDRLAGRIEALGLLYRALGHSIGEGIIDLGTYLSEIASAVMRAHAMDGIHLDLQVDTWPVSLNVAMPAGLVVNELLTNALKHAFRGRDGGAITLHCTTNAAGGCRVLIADDGVGLPAGYSWPKPGKLSALIVRSLLQNAGADMTVTSAPGRGMTVEITFQSPDPGRES
jgi:two-component sensor histidine kinase